MPETPGITKLDIRRKQAYAALCLDAFCAHYEINDQSVRKLVSHLLCALTCPDLPEWEQIGASLEVSGRGEPLPHAVSEHHPANICETLCRLTELCVEVGLVDMYGALTRQPDRFLDACLTLLEEHRIEPPGLEPLVSLTDNTNGWGEPVSDATFRSFVAGLNLDFLPRDTES